MARPAGERFTPVSRGAGIGNRLPADPVITGEDGFRDAASGALDQLGGPFRGGQGDAFPLPFPDEAAFELGEGSHAESMRLAMGSLPPVKTRFSLTNSTRTPLRVRP